MYAIRWTVLTPMRHVRGLYLAPFAGDPLVDTLQSFAPRWTPERGKAHPFADRASAEPVVDLWSTDVHRYLEIVDLDVADRPAGEPARIVTGAEAMTAYGLTPVRAAILQALPSGHGSPMSIDEVAIALRHRDGLRDRLHDEVREELLSMRDGGLVVGSDEPDVEHRRWCRSLNGSFLRAAFCNAIEARASERES